MAGLTVRPVKVPRFGNCSACISMVKVVFMTVMAVGAISNGLEPGRYLSKYKRLQDSNRFKLGSFPIQNPKPCEHPFDAFSSPLRHPSSHFTFQRALHLSVAHQQPLALTLKASFHSLFHSFTSITTIPTRLPCMLKYLQH